MWLSKSNESIWFCIQFFNSKFSNHSSFIAPQIVQMPHTSNFAGPQQAESAINSAHFSHPSASSSQNLHNGRDLFTCLSLTCHINLFFDSLMYHFSMMPSGNGWRNKWWRRCSYHQDSQIHIIKRRFYENIGWQTALLKWPRIKLDGLFHVHRT